MSNNKGSDFTEMDNRKSSEKSFNNINLTVKIDELISLLGKEIVSVCSSPSQHVEKTLYQMLCLRAEELPNWKGSSVELQSACRYLIFNIVNCKFLHNTSEKQNRIFLLRILELSFEILIIMDEDGPSYDYIQSFLKAVNPEECYGQLLSRNQTHVFALECFLNALISIKDRHDVKLPKTLVTIASVDFLSAVRNLVMNVEDQNFSSFVLYALVPKLVKVTHTIVYMLWADLSTDSSSRMSLPSKLFVLCGLADFLILNPIKPNQSIIESIEFWNLIQEGLVSTDTLVRKQALYLLKRAVDVLVTSNMTLDLHIFTWNSLRSSALQQTWEKIFMLYEVLEEKQAHLVTPIIQSLSKSSDIEKNTHSSWLIIGYIRMLSHDSLQVVKLGVIQFLEMTITLFCCYSSTCKLVIETLFAKLNNMLLYHSHSNTIVEWSKVDFALRKWFSSIASNPHLSEELIPVVINAMAKVQWCAIPLFHVIFNLSLAPLDDILNETDLTVLSDFLKEAIKTQNVFVRGAVQCVILNIIAKGTKKSVNIIHIINILSIFRRKECIERGLKSWDVAIEWISSLTLRDDKIIKLLFSDDNNLPIDSKARSLVLLIDCRVIDPIETKFQKALQDYFGVLEDTFKRPYASSEESESCLKLIFHVLEESKYSSSELTQKNDPLLDCLRPYLKEAISYIEKRLLEVDHITNFETIDLYIDVLQIIADWGFLSFRDAVNLNNISKEVRFDPKSHPVQQLLACKIMVWFIRFGSVQKEKTHVFEQIKEHCLLMLKGGHLQINISKKSDESLTRNHQVFWGRLLSGYTWALWSVLQECLDKDFVTQEEMLEITSADNFIELAINSIESGGRESLVPVLKVLKYVFPYALTNYQLCQRFLQFSWQSCFELRKISLFWPSIKAWIELAYSKRIISSGEMRSIIANFSEEIIKEGEAVNGLSNVLLSHLKQELTDVESVMPLLPILTKALVFGLVPRKDQRIESDTYSLIESVGSDLAVNDLIPHPGYGSSQQVRLCALSVLLGVSGQQGGAEVIVSAVKQLVEMDSQLTAKRQRYHGDSLHHRIKHRILQAVLVLQQVLATSSVPAAKSCLVDLIKWCSVGLQGESQQPSVRYQLEWLLCRAMLGFPQLIPDFWTLFNESSEERTGSVCSFISVAFHLACMLRDADFTDRCVAEVLPWCMAQQFNIRLYAQVVLDKLWPLDPTVTAKYEVVRNSLTKSLKQGNTMQNVNKLKNDFYFTTFHPLRHFTLETIFMELPRLSNISRDEWVPLSTIKDSLANYDSYLPLENLDDSLTRFVPPSWVSKATEPEVEVEALAMQKKFVPWKSMFPEFESSSSRTQLIVVASLIDKLPNLGGLTRTCEIFAAECLVVPSLEFTKDKMFSTLSMTAEKHVNIAEVKPYDLPKYLREKKNAGYTLVGAEQTASSVSLESYKFPKKCLLLLGNEKEGVPVSLLPLLDVCVEVPQLGVVRSLNVHVTGALFVWEYTKQRLHEGGPS